MIKSFLLSQNPLIYPSTAVKRGMTTQLIKKTPPFNWGLLTYRGLVYHHYCGKHCAKQADMILER